MPPLHITPHDPASRALIEQLSGYWVFADGGCVGSNPSPLGGTWAYRVIRNGDVLHEMAGSVPTRFGPVTNNLSELVAVVRGIEAAILKGVPRVRLASDSLVTLRRIASPIAPWNGIPGPVREWGRAILREVEIVEAVLLDGHPTRAHLEAGVGKSGRPVSAHNVECDRACNLVAARVKAGEGR